MGRFQLELINLPIFPVIIVIVGFKNFVCCLAWAADFGVQITDEGRSLYIGPFWPAMTSLSRYFDEEIEIIKAASSKYLLNEVIVGQNGPMYKLLPSSVNWTPRSTAQTKQQNKFEKPTFEINTDLNSNCQLLKPGDRRNFNTLQDLLKMSHYRRMADRKENATIDGTSVEK